jgi:hypothetical protein
LYLLYSLVDGLNGSADIPAINKKPAQYINPKVKKGKKKQFSLRDKSERPANMGQTKNDIKDTHMIAHKTYAAFHGDIFLPFYFQGTACNKDNTLCPDLRESVAYPGHGFFKAQKTQKMSGNAKKKNDK